VRITRVESWLVEGAGYNWCFVKVETDAGVSGYGEATNWPGSPLVLAACRHVGERIVGLDARQIDFIWTKLYKDLNWLGQAGPVMSAISGIDIALWDIKGKSLGVPVYELLGGAYRRTLPLYANYWFTGGGHDAESYARQAHTVAADGYLALKFDPFAHVDYLYGEHLAVDLGLTVAQRALAIDVTQAVQRAVGPDVELAIETHALLSAPTAIDMAHRIEGAGIRCMWYEEPAPPEHPDAIARIAARTRLPIAVGERLHTRTMFKPILALGAADYLMPDVTRCGGISEMRKIAVLAEAYHVPIAPHNPNGPLSTVASAHVMAAIPNAFRLEFIRNDVPWRDDVLSHPLPVTGGTFRVPDRPGLGFDLDEVELARHPGVTVARSGFYV
jgi:galactonate dehydratase